MVLADDMAMPFNSCYPRVSRCPNNGHNDFEKHRFRTADSAYTNCEVVCQPSCFGCSSVIGAGCIWKIVQRDNVRPHVARRPLKGVGEIHTPFWPAASPDFSPIEYVWDLIGRELRTHTVEELVSAVDAA